MDTYAGKVVSGTKQSVKDALRGDPGVVMYLAMSWRGKATKPRFDMLDRDPFMTESSPKTGGEK